MGFQSAIFVLLFFGENSFSFGFFGICCRIHFIARFFPCQGFMRFSSPVPSALCTRRRGFLPLAAGKAGPPFCWFPTQHQYVIAKAFYPLLLMVSHKFGVHHHPIWMSDTLGRIIFIHHLRSTVTVSLS